MCVPNRSHPTARSRPYPPLCGPCHPRAVDEDSLDLAKRSSLVARLFDGLGKSAPGALVELRGSLAEAGGGDRFSDIDLRLSVPGEEFESGLRRIHRTLDDIEAVRLFRLDPDAAPTSYSRLLTRCSGTCPCSGV